MKEQMHENFETKRDHKLAELLGISYGELQQTEWEFDEETSNDGLIYSLIVKFRDSSPKEILSKIKGIDENNHVYLPPSALEDGEPE